MERGWCLQMSLKYDPVQIVQRRPVLAAVMSLLHNSPSAFIHRWSSCQKGISTPGFPISYFWSIQLFIPLLWISVVGVGIKKAIFSGWWPKSSRRNQQCWQGWLFSNLNWPQREEQRIPGQGISETLAGPIMLDIVCLFWASSSETGLWPGTALGIIRQARQHGGQCRFFSPPALWLPKSGWSLHKSYGEDHS